LVSLDRDGYLSPAGQATTGLLENGSLTDIPARSWTYITLGHGHDEAWSREFCCRLRKVAYDGWLSLEHEDVMLSRLEGARRSVDLLNALAPREVSDFIPQAI
jgi:sugar phosphate isomerase/epimerase